MAKKTDKVNAALLAFLKANFSTKDPKSDKVKSIDPTRLEPLINRMKRSTPTEVRKIFFNLS